MVFIAYSDIEHIWIMQCFLHEVLCCAQVVGARYILGAHRESFGDDVCALQEFLCRRLFDEAQSVPDQ